MGQTSRRTTRSTPSDPFWALVATARRLHGPGGCAWDRAQTVNSLLPYLVEETWEVFETVRSRRRKELQEELGDALYTILFLTLIAERRGWFRLDTLLQNTREKMVRRHPHVFAGASAPSKHSAYRQWERMKRQEGKARHSPSKAFREILVAYWDGLHAKGRARSRRQAKLRETATPPSATPRRRRAQARGPG